MGYSQCRTEVKKDVRSPLWIRTVKQADSHVPLFLPVFFFPFQICGGADTGGTERNQWKK